MNKKQPTSSSHPWQNQSADSLQHRHVSPQAHIEISFAKWQSQQKKWISLYGWWEDDLNMQQGFFYPERSPSLGSSFWTAFHFHVQQLPQTICCDCSTKPKALPNEDP